MTEQQTESWIDARLSEAEDTLIGHFGEPDYEEQYADLLAEIVGPFADALRRRAFDEDRGGKA